MLAYPLTSVPLTFAHIDGLKLSTDKSTLFSKLEVRIITDASRNIDAFIVDGMFVYSLMLICLQLLVVNQMRLCLVLLVMQIMKTSQLRLLAEAWCQNEHANAM